MVKIKSLYNFVPLNENVFFPKWGNFVNHDVPFKDAKSGKLNLTITTETPIFIRGGGQKDRDEHDNAVTLLFPKKDDRYFIPGSSIKGMLRSVLEIMSFGKLNQFNKDEKRSSVRDMNNKDLYDLLYNVNDLKMGWLVKNGTGNPSPFKILDVGYLGNLRFPGNPISVTHRTLGLGNQLDEFINTKDLGRKYAIYNSIHHDSATNFLSHTNPVIVITSNINGKRNEFKFDNPNLFINSYHISQGQFDDFDLKYHTKDEINGNWEFWKGKLKNGKHVPVFFRVDEDDQLIDFGLTVLYKMLYRYTAKDLIKKFQPDCDSHTFDLTECIFGSIENEKALKGRVSIAPAFITSNINEAELPIKEKILGSPKKSFYPFYIKQDVYNDGELLRDHTNANATVPYKTLMDFDIDKNNNDEYPASEISGRKRYPVHTVIQEELGDVNSTNEENEKIKIKFKPLPESTVFNTDLHYHNLRPVELGAILSAISFHNTPDCKHNIGMAKPLGYGRINIEIKGMDITEQKGYMWLFEQQMDNFLENKPNWLQTEQIKELCTIAYPSPNQDKSKLGYLELEEFAEIKKWDNPPMGLPLFSDFMGYSKVPESLNNSVIYKKDDFDQFFEIIETANNKIKDELDNLIEKLNIKKQIIEAKNITSPQTTVEIGMKLIALIISNKKVRIIINGEPAEVQLVLKMEQKTLQLIKDDQITVYVKQLKKDGTIAQVEII